MFDKNIIENLPIDLQKYIAINFLDAKSIQTGSLVSKAWSTLFSHSCLWEQKIIQDFDIAQEHFSSLPVSDNPKQQSLFYRMLYPRLKRLERNYDHLQDYMRQIYQKDKKFLLLICADNADVFQNIPCEEQDTLLKMSIHAGCLNIPTVFLQNYDLDRDYYLEVAAESGHVELVRFLLNPDSSGLKPSVMTLHDAVRSGNHELVRFLLDFVKPDSGLFESAYTNLKLVNFFLELGLQPDKWILDLAVRHAGNFEVSRLLLELGIQPDNSNLYNAAQSGNLELVQYLLDPNNEFELQADEYTLHSATESGNLELVRSLINRGIRLRRDILSVAASGNLELAQYLLNPDNHFGIYPKETDLIDAVRKGNLELVQYLLDFGIKLTPNNSILHYPAYKGNLKMIRFLLNPDNNFELQPDQETLNNAARSGNFELVHFLLNPDNNFGLQPDQMTLNNAAISGNFELAQYFLNSDKFGLSPNQDTLDCAAASGDLQLVRFLLKPDYQFDILPDDETQEQADKSGNRGLSEHLIPSAIKIQKVLRKLKKGDFEAAQHTLQEAFHACTNYCSSVVKHVLFNPNNYKLNDEATQFLLSILDEIEKGKKRISSESLEENESKRLKMML